MPASTSSARWVPHVALFGASLLWASSFIALKIAFRAYDPMVVIFGRMFVASLCFLPVLRSSVRNIDYHAGDWKPLLFMALCEPCLYFIFEAMAMERTSASQAGMIVAMMPLIIAAGAHFVLKETVSRRTLLGFGLAIAGACLLSVDSMATDNAPAPVLGNFLEFLAMVCASGYMITLKRLCLRYPPLFLTAVQAFTGAVFYLPLLLLPSTQLPTAFAPGPFAAIIYLGAAITLGAYGLYNYGTSKIPVNQASAYTNLIPLFTLVMGVSLLGDVLTPLQYGASGLVLVGVLLSQHRPPGTSPTASAPPAPADENAADIAATAVLPSLGTPPPTAPTCPAPDENDTEKLPEVRNDLLE